MHVQELTPCNSTLCKKENATVICESDAIYIQYQSIAIMNIQDHCGIHGIPGS